jgi:DNA-binding NarL/FixJ family response regulator
MSCTRILIIAHPGANLDSLYAVLPALVEDVALFRAAELADIQATIQENHPHLVLIDSEVGFQEARSIHELITSNFPEIKIIVLSDAAHWQRWKTISSSHQVLLKGFSSRRLKGILSKALSSSQSIEVRPAA